MIKNSQELQILMDQVFKILYPHGSPVMMSHEDRSKYYQDYKDNFLDEIE